MDDFHTNDLYDGPPVESADILTIYIIVNGSLGMSTGKIAAQAFHCGTWVRKMDKWPAFFTWTDQGRRVSVRVAETAHVFRRVTEECEGHAQKDEGLTEVERGSITAFATIPYRRDQAPKILSHKRCQLL